VQWCRGLDGRVDALRIADEIRRLGEFDIICLQEVADHFADPRLAGSDGSNQFAHLAALFPAYTLLEGVAVDHAGDTTTAPRRRFGNAILARLPVAQVIRHALPFPPDPGVRSMPRMALEAVVQTPAGPLRIVTTHLEYHSRVQRSAQVDALRGLYAEAHARAAAPLVSDDGSPFHDTPRPTMTLLCGDFNMPATDALYARMLAPFTDATPALADAWPAAHPGTPQPPTFCVHEPYAPGMLPFACDFVFVNAPLRERLRDVQVDVDTRASDHQPVMVTLA
jgi:endonuclease/exonuclease/phosphatase family metal-dependent hydrolase